MKATHFKMNSLDKLLWLSLTIIYSTYAVAEIDLETSQNSDQYIERIQVTGYAIKRTDYEGAQSITVINKQQLDSLGVTSAAELMTKLPVMQGYTTAGQSVGGGGGAIQSVSLRNLGRDYTLVLLNGKRMASANDGASVDITTIPFALIERVEILTEGASALYGSDAIAGVVNFILKDNLTSTHVSGRFEQPEDSGGEKSSITLTTGWGDKHQDGYNLTLAFSHNNQNDILASERDFASTGILEFDHNDQRYVAITGSSFPTSANAYLSFPEGSGMSNLSLNPYANQNGECEANSAPSGSVCSYDYAADLGIHPETSNTSVLMNGQFELNNNTEAYIQAGYSDSSFITIFAPQNAAISLPDLSLLSPYLTSEQQLNYQQAAVNARWRVHPAGSRSNELASTNYHWLLGVQGMLAKWDYDLSASYSSSSRETNIKDGYLYRAEFNQLIESGAIDIFAASGSATAEQTALIQQTEFSGNWETQDTSNLSIEGQVSAPIMSLGHDDLAFAVGFDYRETDFDKYNSPIHNEKVVMRGQTTEYDFGRETAGLFTEFYIPLLDNLTITTSARYDYIGDISGYVDRHLASGEKDQIKGLKSYSDSTYKIAIAYQPNDDWLLRLSHGTGFKAPSLKQIAEPRANNGDHTKESYTCPFSATDSYSAYCLEGQSQYPVVSQGNIYLESETSKQLSTGFVYSPNTGFSMSIDYWQIKMENQVSSVSESQAFKDAQNYRELFTIIDQQLTWIKASVNVGESKYSGVDARIELSQDISLGTLFTRLTGTVMLESEQLEANSTDSWNANLGEVGKNNAVSFRHQWQLTNSLQMDKTRLNLNLNYKGGYQDIEKSVCLASDYADCGHLVQLEVDSYITLDSSISYRANGNLSLAFGANNLFDEEPPLTLNSAGGWQRGYDSRYASAYGRSLFVSMGYDF